MKAPDHVLRTAGTTSCPWTISVDPHQKLRFYLLSFGFEQQASTVVGACSRFVVFEESRRTQERLCRAPVRQTLLYTSTTNRVSVSQTIGVPEKRISSIVYMLQYEGLWGKKHVVVVYPFARVRKIRTHTRKSDCFFFEGGGETNKCLFMHGNNSQNYCQYTVTVYLQNFIEPRRIGALLYCP